MFMDWFVFDFVIFSFTDDYNDVFGDLEWFQMGSYVKTEEKAKTVRAGNFSKTGQTLIKLQWSTHGKIMIFGG